MIVFSEKRGYALFAFQRVLSRGGEDETFIDYLGGGDGYFDTPLFHSPKTDEIS